LPYYQPTSKKEHVSSACKSFHKISTLQLCLAEYCLTAQPFEFDIDDPMFMVRVWILRSTYTQEVLNDAQPSMAVAYRAKGYQ
jgi:hypothetical protein